MFATGTSWSLPSPQSNAAEDGSKFLRDLKKLVENVEVEQRKDLPPGLHEGMMAGLKLTDQAETLATGRLAGTDITGAMLVRYINGLEKPRVDHIPYLCQLLGIDDTRQMQIAFHPHLRFQAVPGASGNNVVVIPGGGGTVSREGIKRFYAARKTRGALSIDKENETTARLLEKVTNGIQVEEAPSIKTVMETTRFEEPGVTSIRPSKLRTSKPAPVQVVIREAQAVPRSKPSQDAPVTHVLVTRSVPPVESVAGGVVKAAHQRAVNQWRRDEERQQLQCQLDEGLPTTTFYAKVRELLGGKMETIATKTGLSTNELTALERFEHCKPPSAFLKRYAEVLGFSYKSLMRAHQRQSA